MPEEGADGSGWTATRGRAEGGDRTQIEERKDSGLAAGR